MGPKRRQTTKTKSRAKRKPRSEDAIVKRLAGYLGHAPLDESEGYARVILRAFVLRDVMRSPFRTSRRSTPLDDVLAAAKQSSKMMDALFDALALLERCGKGARRDA